MKLCTPAVVYLGLSAITILLAFMRKMSIGTIVLKAIFVALWAWILNFICVKGYTTISWILVLLPLVMTFGVFALVIEMYRTRA